MEIPKLEDWKSDIQDRVVTKGQTQEDILEIIQLCEVVHEKMEPASAFIRDQQNIVVGMLNEFKRHYVARFGEEPPRRQQSILTLLELDSTETRRKRIRSAALSITDPGHTVTDRQVLGKLETQGFKLIAENPTATISSVLNGFKSEFEKVSGKRGVFKRREPTITE